MAKYPLVRAMLAQVYNNSFLSTHQQHQDLTAEDIDLVRWVACQPVPSTVAQMSFYEIAAAEARLVEQPELASHVSDGRADDQCDPLLVLVANAYCEYLGLV